MLQDSGRLDALRLTWKPGQPNPPHVFWESDIAKWVEAASYSLGTHPDPDLEALLDGVIALLDGAQQPDGYLNAYYTVVEPGKRFTNLRDQHELYAAGHLIESAVAHHLATGRRTLLDIARRYADLLAATFGPGRRTGYCGHEEIELALVKLYRVTGERRHLDLSRYFLDARGQEPNFFLAEAATRNGSNELAQHHDRLTLEYLQAHKPVRELDAAVGHAVRMMYLGCGMVDAGAATDDATLYAAARRVWESAVQRRMYITGGVGSSHQGEAFTGDYDLPNRSAYAETCAAIGLLFFSHRLLQVEADGRYADVIERALYNGILSGISFDGTRFFYVNPLSSDGHHHRQDWYDCACCPPNVARLLASLGGYVCSTTPRALFVHLYLGGRIKAQIGGQTVELLMAGRYPWEERIALTVRPERPSRFDLRLRVPGWCRHHRVRVNDKPVAAPVTRGYARLTRTWAPGDCVELDLAMPVERIAAHPYAEANRGCVALQRGPLVYCLENCDHSVDVRTLRLPRRAALTPRFDARLPGGAVVLEGRGLAPAARTWTRQLYQPAADVTLRPTPLRAIPYYLWDHRAPGAMVVWIPEA